jgi:hypothetical protein
MPNGDGTGPNGTYVNCSPQEGQNYVGFGRGRGNGRGFGNNSKYNPRGELRPRFGGRNVNYDSSSKENEQTFLGKQIELLQNSLSGIEKKLDDLKR